MDEVQLADLIAHVADHVADLITIVDQTGAVRWANRRAIEVIGATPGEWHGRQALGIVHPDDLALGFELRVAARAMGPGVKEPVMFRVRGADGEWVWMEVAASNVELAGGELATVLSSRPSAQRRDTAVIVDEATERLTLMFEGAAIGMALVAVDGRLLRVNGAFADLLSAPASELVGSALTDLVHGEDLAEVAEVFGHVADGTPRVGRLSARFVGRDGRLIHTELTVSLVDDRHGQAMYCAMQVVDVTALKEAEAELLHRSTHDPLTGLVNRPQLFHLLDQALARAARREEQVAVLFVDLDGFKTVNDTHGHGAGDELLGAVGERLTGAVRRGDVVARIGGDEFVVMCEQISQPDEAIELAERLVAALREPFVIDAGTVDIGASVGLACEPAMLVGADELVRNADAALYEAKRGGRNRAHRHERTPHAGPTPRAAATEGSP